jgi:hypothetical protein
MMRSDHLSPRTSSALLIGHPERHTVSSGFALTALTALTVPIARLVPLEVAMFLSASLVCLAGAQRKGA